VRTAAAGAVRRAARAWLAAAQCLGLARNRARWAPTVHACGRAFGGWGICRLVRSQPRASRVCAARCHSHTRTGYAL